MDVITIDDWKGAEFKINFSLLPDEYVTTNDTEENRVINTLDGYFSNRSDQPSASKAKCKEFQCSHCLRKKK